METIRASTRKREQLVDITAEVEKAVAAGGGLSGICVLYCPHTTAGLTVNEGADPDVAADIVAGFSRLVPRDGSYRHVEGNSDAHLKATLAGSSLAVPVKDGRLVLGTWQRIFLCEFDGPRERTVTVMVLGRGQGGR